MTREFVTITDCEGQTVELNPHHVIYLKRAEYAGTAPRTTAYRLKIFTDGGGFWLELDFSDARSRELAVMAITGIRKEY